MEIIINSWIFQHEKKAKDESVATADVCVEKKKEIKLNAKLNVHFDV